MTKHCPTCQTPNACDIGNLCAYRDMAVIERAMARVDAMQQPQIESPPMWIGAVIIAAFAVWVVSMLVQTGAV